jgi:superfamily II DNA/RNA helicase
MPIHPLLKKGLHKLGFTKPTEIQKQAIPVAVNGSPASEEEGDESDEDMEGQPEKRLRDVVGVAETVS